MDYKIKKGDEFLCITSLSYVYNSQEIVFSKGDIYKSNCDGLINDNLGTAWTVYGIETYFSCKFFNNFKLINICQLEGDIDETPEQIGIKESDGKLNIEYDWDFLKAQMNRMAKNKSKYPKNNWKKPMDIKSLKDALFRHTLEVMNNNFDDDGDDLGHLSAIALNSMFIFNNLFKNKKDINM